MKICRCKYCGARTRKGEDTCEYCKSKIVTIKEKYQLNPITEKFEDLIKMIGCSRALMREKWWFFGFALSILLFNTATFVMFFGSDFHTEGLALLKMLIIAGSGTIAVLGGTLTIYSVKDIIKTKRQIQDDLYKYM